MREVGDSKARSKMIVNNKGKKTKTYSAISSHYISWLYRVRVHRMYHPDIVGLPELGLQRLELQLVCPCSFNAYIKQWPYALVY